MHIVPLYAALLALIFVALSVRTLRMRRRLRIAVGDGGDTALLRAMRVHANFAEYVPLSLLLIVVAVGLLFRHSPRRKQPALSWLLFGATLSTVLWWAASLLLAGYVNVSDGFGATYGPLTAIMALLLWANLTGISLFLGLSFAAQLEAQRVGVVRPAQHDQWDPPRDRRAGVYARRAALPRDVVGFPAIQPRDPLFGQHDTV